MARIVSIVSFLFLFGLAAFVAGLWSADMRNGAFVAYRQIVSAWRALDEVEEGDNSPDLIRGVPAVLTATRFTELAQDGEPIVLLGGNGHFLDICPPPGCLAAAFGRDGSVVRAWPLRAEDLAIGPAIVEGGHSYAGADAVADQSVTAVRFYDNGDLLVSLRRRNTFPYGFGLARIAPDGSVIWRRRDYAHHWPHLLASGNAIVPVHRIVSGEPHAGADRRIRRFLRCETKQYVDEVAEIDPDGGLLRSVDILRLMTDDPHYRFMLARSANPCDPLHVNHVAVASEAQAAGSDTVEPGDMLVSMRSISAVALVSADWTWIKRVYAGSFTAQHAAQFLPDGAIVLLDNMGGDTETPPSRVLRIDADSGSEQVLHAPSDPDDAMSLTTVSGDIALSSDGSRALVTYTNTGYMVEVSLTGGQVLSRYDHVHPDTTRSWRRLRLNSAVYLPPTGG